MTINNHLTNPDAYPQFLVSKIVKEGNLIKKYPCSMWGIPASHKDPANWMTLSTVTATVARLGPNYRVGFSITQESMYFFLDIDKCYIEISPGVWDWSPLAKKLCELFAGCFIEVSQSGKGLHIIGRYVGPCPQHLNKIESLGIELYTHDRYVMFGNISPTGDWNFEATKAFHTVINEYFDPTNKPKVTQLAELPTGEHQLTDDQVLIACREHQSARAVFGNGATFDDLYTANEEALARAYPSSSEGKIYNGSSADLAIANMIMYAGANEEQAERIMRTSALNRDKWDRPGYLARTIHNAAPARNMTLNQQANSNKPTDTSQPLVDDMPQEYQGCYYVLTHEEVYSIQHASLLSTSAFNICYSQPIQDKKPYAIFEKHAATTGHIVHQACFKPELPHGEILIHEDLRLINVYKPINVKMTKGDMSPFLNFLDTMLPDKRDQRILLSYAAALVQNPGLKAMWCPVIQGVEGCGKSFFADLISRVVGEKYTHRAKSSELESNFSGHWFARLLMLVEDVSLKKSKLEDALKPLITARRYAFEPKGCDIFMGDFPINFIITANNVDIIKKEEETRRYSFLMCAQQTRADRIKAGFTNGYFSALANWRDNGGEEFFAYFLHNYKPDPEFDFSKGCNTAPDTSTTAQAIESNRSEPELIIQEAIDSGRVGFRGDFISGTMLSRLFQEQSRRGIYLLNNQRSKVLKALGYEMHPNLVNGRASRVVTPDNNQPSIYVKTNHPTFQIKDKEAIMKAYENAQK